MMEILDAARIKNLLAARTPSTAVRDIIVYDAVDSTMNAAKKLLAERGADAADRTVIFAETQTAGRGRRGRAFFSPARTGVYGTLILCPKNAIAAPPLLTPLTAVAVCRALEKISAPKIPQIKWVNDILIDRRKVAGILVEADFFAGRAVSVLVGIGVNVSTVEFPAELREIAGACATGKNLPRAEIAANLIAHFFALYDNYEPSAILTAYRARSAIIGREITYERGGAVFTALAESINDDGNLVARGNDGKITLLNAGEISVKWDYSRD